MSTLSCSMYIMAKGNILNDFGRIVIIIQQ